MSTDTFAAIRPSRLERCKTIIEIINDPYMEPVLFMVIERIEWEDSGINGQCKPSDPEFLTRIQSLKRYTIFFNNKWTVYSTRHENLIIDYTVDQQLYQKCVIDANSEIIVDDNILTCFWDFEFILKENENIILCLSDDIDLLIMSNTISRRMWLLIESIVNEYHDRSAMIL